MQELTQILRDATSKIQEGYFLLNIDGGASVYRERVYCYELYHQLRTIWPAKTEFYLNGEVDKAAHPILRKLDAGGAKPDFLVHKPGYMSGNHAIIEVKSIRAVSSGIKKDLKTLDLFLQNVKYERAIYLIYGCSMDEKVLLQKISDAYDELGLVGLIEVWLHKRPGDPAEHLRSIVKQSDDVIATDEIY